MTALPTFTLHNGDDPAFPVLLSVPHAGRDYPGPMLDALRVAAGELLRLEDRYADRLVQPAIAAGFPAIIANRARAWADLNRAENDYDSGMFSGSGLITLLPAPAPSAKTRGGLGLIPRRLQSCGELWRGPFSAADYCERVEAFHRPYHQAIDRVLGLMRQRFGLAILLDVHSMPPLSAAPMPSQFVIGDRYGRSAGSLHSEIATAHLQQAGYKVALNAPYPGDHILAQHGNPARNIHAIQLEIDRTLYLDASLREPSQQLGQTARLVQSLAVELTGQSIGYGFAEAAE